MGPEDPDMNVAVHTWWDKFDKRYMRPVFGGAAPNNPDFISPAAVPSDGEVVGPGLLQMPGGGASHLPSAWSTASAPLGASECVEPGQGEAGVGLDNEEGDMLETWRPPSPPGLEVPSSTEPWRPPSPTRPGMGRRDSI